MNTIESIRASSLATLFDCAYCWEGIYILGMTKTGNGRMHLGSALHASTAILDLAQKDGAPILPDQVTDVFHKEFTQPEYEVDWKHDDLNKSQAEHIGVKLNNKYYSEYTQKTIFSSVEKQIDSVIIEVPRYGIDIMLTGKLDRSRTVVSKDTRSYGIVDLKSGKNAINKDGIATTKGHAAQIGVYELLESITSDYDINMPAKIIGMQTTKNGRIGEGVIYGAKDRVVGTEENPGYIEMAAHMLKTGFFPPNPRATFCSEKYCPRWHKCVYKEE